MREKGTVFKFYQIRSIVDYSVFGYSHKDKLSLIIYSSRTPYVAILYRKCSLMLLEFIINRFLNERITWLEILALEVARMELWQGSCWKDHSQTASSIIVGIPSSCSLGPKKQKNIEG
jgi:hypothetical protein